MKIVNKKITIFLVAFCFETFIGLKAFATCSTEAIVINRQIGLSLSLDAKSADANFAENESISIPFSINDQAACFKKSSKLTVSVDEDQDEKNATISIDPMRVDFENVSSPSVKQYLYIDQGKNLSETKIYALGFVCAGEIPVSADAIYGSYLDFSKKSRGKETSVKSIITIGSVASKFRAKYDEQMEQDRKNAFDFYYKLYSSITTNNSSNPSTDNNLYNSKESEKENIATGSQVSVPDVFTGASFQMLTEQEIKVTKTFATISDNVVNGCSNVFAEKMKNYVLENYESNESLKNFKTRTKWFSDTIVVDLNPVAAN